MFRFETELMEDVGAIAKLNLENRLLRIKAKAIARATAKYLATQAAAAKAREKNASTLARIIEIAGSAVSVATERADVRHWRLLPAQIRVGRAVVPPGRYGPSVSFVNAAGHTVASRVLTDVTVGPGEKKFIIQRSIE